MDVDVANGVIFVVDLSWKLIVCLLGCKDEKWKLSKEIICKKMTFSKQIICQKMTFSKEIIFLKGERIENFHTCEVFEVFEIFEVRET